jgi:hypothetical protein
MSLVLARGSGSRNVFSISGANEATLGKVNPPTVFQGLSATDPYGNYLHGSRW